MDKQINCKNSDNTAVIHKNSAQGSRTQHEGGQIKNFVKLIKSFKYTDHVSHTCFHCFKSEIISTVFTDWHLLSLCLFTNNWFHNWEAACEGWIIAYASSEMTLCCSGGKSRRHVIVCGVIYSEAQSRKCHSDTTSGQFKWREVRDLQAGRECGRLRCLLRHKKASHTYRHIHTVEDQVLGSFT